MMDKHCCDDNSKNCNCSNCSCSNVSHSMMILDCCKEHKMSKEHLEQKKKRLEEKLKWVMEELSKK